MLKHFLVAGLLTISFVASSPAQTPHEPSLVDGFVSPSNESHPETWFHLIGGNVSRDALTTDLEAIASAGIRGIQLFHGRGRPWPGVTPQIQTLSETWDSLISRVADETQRLGLKFTMQNCPGWAMSGGPWITPDKAMRHLIHSRVNVVGGDPISVKLSTPEPSEEEWRDYQDIAVLAFPTPDGESSNPLIPSEIRSSVPDSDWAGLVDGKDVKIQIPVKPSPPWVEFVFDEPVTLRSIALPPTEFLLKRMMFDPKSSISAEVFDNGRWRNLVTHKVPRGNWQDRQPEVHYVLAVPDAKSTRYRLSFHNQRPLEISHLRLSSAARVQDWCGQAGYALRSLERTPPPKQSATAWVPHDDVIDLTKMMNVDGEVSWNAPTGKWTIVRFGHVNTGVKNKPAPPEATGFECDKLSTEGADQHFAGYIGRLSKRGGAADGGRLQGMLIDSWECYTQTWTPAMEKEFESRRGYALRSWLPALAGWVVDDHPTSERFLRDWRATISDLIVENYFGRLAELGRERGLELSFETAIGDVSPGDILQYFKSADVPMCEVWKPNDPHVGGLETKPIAPTTSAAHIYGKPRVAAETFTSAPMNWREHPFSLKNVADRSLALGVTHLVFHTYTHNPLSRLPGTSFGGSIGTPLLRGQTWWQHMPHFTEYLARCQHMLEQGRPVADVLWYLGDDVDHKPRQDTPFPSGYHFDYLNADALLNRLSVDDGDLVIPEGTRWRVLWLAEEQCRRLTPTTLKRIEELLQDGATVIGQAPLMNPSLSEHKKADAEFNALVEQLWGNKRAKDRAGRYRSYARQSVVSPPSGDGSYLESGDRRIGKGRMLWGGTLKGSLEKLGIPADVAGTLPERWCHRRIGQTDIYFVIGSRTAPVNATLQFRARGIPEFWNPIDGSRKPAVVFQPTETGTAIPIRLPAAGSTFVVFRPEPEVTQYASVSLKRISRDEAVLLDATDPSRVDTTAGFPAFGSDRYGITQPWVSPEAQTIELDDKGKNLIAWMDGKYDLLRGDNEEASITVTGTKDIDLGDDWSLSFPDGWDAPDETRLAQVQPWSELEDPAARHFSGTATYETTFSLKEKQPGQRLQLDLGRVGNIAEIQVNGKIAGVIWSAPYRQDITAYAKPGENTLSIKVTNTWHNRLVWDAHLPAKDRKTWTFGYPEQDSPLEFSGLSRNVHLRIGKLIFSFK